ncbi:glycoside hydrolase superfamily [Aspergillus multicolor]|uniref:putative cell wall glucanase (Scw11) n=1 Tax=Aspergillus multicolor TaxID=41759 RepID=UPI003CCE278B
MRGAILATAAALAGTAVADMHMRRHAHEDLHHRALHAPSAAPEEECGCTTEVITYWGEPTTIPLPVTSSTSTSTPVEVPTSTVTSETTQTVESTSTSTVTVTATSSASAVETPSQVPSETPVETPVVTLPTAGVTSYSETGTYTIPATTLTVTDTTTVCGATTTDLPSGTHTYGGVTTIVETATTITCPYATVKPTGSTVTSVIETTTYVCPSAGTYTIAPTTTYVPTSTVVVYPTPATVTPGTYTNPGTTVTVTRTEDVYYCPYTNANEPTSVPAVTTSAVPTTAVPTTEAPTTEAPTTTAVSTTSVVSSSSSTSSSATSVPTGVSGTQMGMTFTPYNNDGTCMSKSDVLSKVAVVKQKGFSHVRVYGTDCNTLEYVGEACKTHSLQMILGVSVDSSSGLDGARSQFSDITSWGQWDLVSLIAVGNEVVNQKIASAAQLASFISEAASAFSAAGYTGQVTTAEPIDTWLASGSTLCPVVDILGANLHPFFNAEFTAAEAGTLVSNQINDLKEVCSGKDVINLETGWPNAGNANGKAVPGQSEQTTAIKALLEKVGGVSVFFSYADDGWKSKFASSDTYGVEQHWGCIDQFK